ncbi:[NiFe] hydrogenase maturation protein HypF [Campylobacter jejuni subsp. doylei]|nr:[NiFe] hydrogenase maturation protein HypF [Campylobacter jejuni subsp. doylei]
MLLEVLFELRKSSYEAQVGLMCEAFYDKNLDFLKAFVEKGS